MSRDNPAGEAPEIFSPDDPLDELWVRAYQGEVLGEALFAGIADRLVDAGQAHKMMVLAVLERRTREAVAPALERAGIPIAPDADMLGLADALVADSVNHTWEELMSSTVDVTGQYLPLYRRIGELSPPEKDTADLLVAHEEALRDFARAELAGATETSLDPITALAHMR